MKNMEELISFLADIYGDYYALKKNLDGVQDELFRINQKIKGVLDDYIKEREYKRYDKKKTT